MTLAQGQTNTHNPPPTIPAFRENGQLVIRCPFCKQTHRHGVAGGDGLRVAHCTDDRHDSYLLVEVRGVVLWVAA